MKAIIIDDEAKGRSALKNLLTLIDDSVQVMAEASSVAAGVALIDDSEPELVFLDIQMDDGTGFDVLEQIRFKDFQLIFVTAHDEYALRAFRYSAIDYLTKPVDPDLLRDALLKVRENSEKYDLNLKAGSTGPESVESAETRAALPEGDRIGQEGRGRSL